MYAQMMLRQGVGMGQWGWVRIMYTASATHGVLGMTSLEDKLREGIVGGGTSNRMP